MVRKASNRYTPWPRSLQTGAETRVCAGCESISRYTGFHSPSKPYTLMYSRTTTLPSRLIALQRDPEPAVRALRACPR
jgi:hypothetical protein